MKKDMPIGTLMEPKEDILIVNIIVDLESLDVLSCSVMSNLIAKNLKKLEVKLSTLLSISKSINLTAVFINSISNPNNIKVLGKLERYLVNDQILYNVVRNKALANVDYSLSSILRLKGRSKNERIVLFSSLNNKLIMNKNNGSYFYEIDKILSGRFIDNLLEELCNE